MSEFVLFVLAGIAAVGFAAAMLLSDNAVHSALFLIGTMGCIAFLFLLLNAPFLAMIQITVYTGAIMVLFLFVIMLLGAERLFEAERSPDARRFAWYTPLAIGLAAALFVVVGIVLSNVNLNLQPPGTPPQVRVVNAAPDAGLVDVYANDQLLATGLAYGDDPEYVSLPPGDYAIRVVPSRGDEVDLNLSLANNTEQTLIEYGDPAALSISVIADDNSTVADRNGRLTFFNAYPDVEAVQVVDLGSEFDDTDTRVIVGDLAQGQVSEPLVWNEGVVNWAFVDANDPTNVLQRLENYDVQRDTSDLIVLTQERIADGTTTGALRTRVLPIATNARSAFGGPRAIGLELFTNYVLVFQLLALLLLAAMVGAIVLTHREIGSVAKRVTGRRRVSRPLVSVIASQVGHDVTEEGVPELQEPVGE